VKEISSSSNTLYKSWLRLTRQTNAKSHDLLLEGAHICQAWLARFGVPEWVLLRSGSQNVPEIAELLASLPTDRQVWLEPRLMRGLSSLSSEPAVIFVAQRPQASTGQQWREGAVVLDAIQDPGNVGTLIRTAAAAGIDHVVAGRGSANCWSAKALRAGQGAQFHVAIHEAVDLSDWLSHLVSEQDPSERPLVLATTLGDTSTSLFELDLPERVIWLFGHEGQGLSAELAAMADQCVHIPHKTAAVESLNVASAAAICLFEHRRQRSLAR